MARYQLCACGCGTKLPPVSDNPVIKAADGPNLIDGHTLPPPEPPPEPEAPTRKLVG